MRRAIATASVLLPSLLIGKSFAVEVTAVDNLEGYLIF